jgi:ubiquinol-cytochrome c reductase iron-sulfur subunit
MNPSASTIAAAAPIEVDLAPIAEGQVIKVFWRSKPIFISHRTKKEIDDARSIDWHNLASYVICCPLSRRLRCFCQIPSGIGERYVAEHVREVTQLAPTARIVFFRQETNVVARREQALEKFPGIVVAPEQDVIVGEPKTAGEKCPFAGWQSVGGSL